ncbi:MAG: hypothetical protein ACI8RD_013438 [Bacillariaceae sp.]|jgi:hypothetical protein
MHCYAKFTNPGVVYVFAIHHQNTLSIYVLSFLKCQCSTDEIIVRALLLLLLLPPNLIKVSEPICLVENQSSNFWEDNILPLC